jgi:NADH dehydrogenase FAD-containing subunit
MYKNLIIVGGGFAGMRTARELEHTLPPDWTLTVISQENFITFDPTDIFGIRLSGFVPWLMWRGLHLLRIPTLARKTRLFLEWNWAMFFPPDIAHFGYRRTQRHTSYEAAVPARAPAAKPAEQDPR